MKNKLGHSIKQLRGERGLTQDELARAMHVTAGAVYKWESGLSSPDISMLVQLASFFEVSVDSLLGYRVKNCSLSAYLERIRSLVDSRQLEEAAQEADSAMRQYPNSFAPVYAAAMTEYMLMTENSYIRALELFSRALELIGQNTTPGISEYSINISMAQIYSELGRYDEALEIFRRFNHDGGSEAYIGRLSMLSGKGAQAALPHLTGALVGFATPLLYVCDGYTFAYLETGEYRSGAELSLFVVRFFEGLRVPGKVMYWDRFITAGYIAAAVFALLDGCGDEARGYVRTAYDCATRYDREPVHDLSNMKFFHSDKTGLCFDKFGDTAEDVAMYELRELAGTCAAAQSAAEKIKLMWEETKNEHS